MGLGPILSHIELCAEMSLVLTKVPEQVHSKLRRRMLTAAPYAFDYGDLANVNIIAKNGNLVLIPHTESSGFSLFDGSLYVQALA